MPPFSTLLQRLFFPRTRQIRKRRLVLQLEILETREMLSVSSTPTLAIPIYGTGLDNNRSLLAGGATDSHYNLISAPSPDSAGPTAVVLRTSSAFPSWIADGTSSQWIAPHASQGTGTEPLGQYIYQTTFPLTNFDTTTTTITGEIADANQLVQVTLNGQNLGISRTGTQNYTSFLPFTISPSYLVAGTNTLDFVINNVTPGSQIGTGLQVQIQGTAKSLTTTSVSSSANPASSGQAVTLYATVAALAGGVPSGSVTFYNGSTALGSATLTNGSAQFTTSSLASGTHSITVQYAGDSNDDASTGTFSQVISGTGLSSTSTTVTSSVNPAVADQPVTLNAAVTSSSGTPTGTVSFYDATTLLGTATLSAGAASLTTSALPVGSQTITVNYAGDSSHAASSGVLNETIGLASSSTSATSSANPAVYAQSVTLSATVTSPYGTPTGTVTFLDGSTSLGSATLSAGAASLQTSALAVGNNTITVNYGGDAAHAASTTALTETISLDSSTTTVTSSVNPATADQPVTLSATVTSPFGTPSGSVSFYDGTTLLGTATLSAGTASLTTSALAVGSQTITVNYAGDSSHASSSGVLNETIRLASSSTNATSSANPAVYDEPVTFNVAVTSPYGTPTGTVTFLDGTTSIGSATLSAGAASWQTAALAVGSHTITVNYGGDAAHAASTTALTETIGLDSSTTTVTSSLNPAPANASVTLKATVASPFTTPTGSVVFLDGTITLGTATLVSGVATYTTSSLAVGNHPITVNYGGDANDTASSGTLTESINLASTTTTLTSSLNPVVGAASVTLSATVTSPYGTPTGTISFYDGTTLLGTVTLATGVASLPISNLWVGTHAITAVYSGDSSFATSTSAVLDEVDNPDLITVGPNETTGVDLNTIAWSPSGLPLVFTITEEPTNGTLTTDPITGAYDYTPNLNFTGNDSFIYKATDGQQYTTVNTVSLLVQDAAPVANDETVSALANQSTSIALDDYWADTGDTISTSIVNQPTNGTLAYDSTSDIWNYTPKPGFTGTDSFTWLINDGIEDSNLATVSITVTNPTPPVAQNQTVNMAANKQTSIALVSTTTAANGNPLTTAIVQPPLNGTLTYNTISGLYDYQPNQNFTGTDSFQFQVNDGVQNSNVATVTINVAYPAPTAGNDSMVVYAGQPSTIDLSYDVYAASNTTLNYYIGQQPTNGSASVNLTSGLCTYTPNANFSGTDSFTYYVKDTFLPSDQATISVTVLPPAPVATNAAVSTTANQALSIDLTAYAQASTPDSSLVTGIVQGPANGTLTYDSQSSLYDYTPATGFVGSDSFTFQALNGGQLSNVATVSITVLPPAPVANSISLTDLANQRIVIPWLQYASDSLGTLLVPSIQTKPTNGTASFDPTTQLFTYLPNAGFTGSDSFTYLVNDGLQNSTAATVSINVVSAATPRQGSTKTWVGTDSNNWFDPNNWSPVGVPTTTSDVVIAQANASITTTNGAQGITVNSLFLQAGALTVAPGVTLTVQSCDGTTPSNLQVQGVLAVNGTVAINSTAIFNGGNITINSAGAFNWQGGTITSLGNAQFVNNGIFTDEGGTSWVALDTASSFQDNGALIENDPGNPTTLAIAFKVNGNQIGSMTINGQASPSGLVWVQQGTLQLADNSATPWVDGSQATDGTFLVNQNATLSFGNGNFDLDPFSSITGAGTVALNGSNWTDQGAYSVGTTNVNAGVVNFEPAPNQVSPFTIDCSLAGGNLGGWGTFTISGLFNWTNGTVVSYDPNAQTQGRGQQFTLVATGTTTLNGPPLGYLYNTNVGYNCTFYNYGTLTWLGGSFAYSGLAEVHNHGTFTAQGSGPLFTALLAGVFNDAAGVNNVPGLLNATSGMILYSPQQPTQQAAIACPFNNSGTVQVNAGTLQLVAGNSTGGTFVVQPGATLAVSHYDFDDTSSIQAAGATLDFSGGGYGVDINCPVTVTTINIAGPTVSFNSNVTVPTTTLTSGSLSGSGTYTIGSTFSWTGGAMAGTGTTVVSNGATLDIQVGALPILGLSGTLQNNGLITWDGTNDGLLTGTGTIVNNGTFTKSTPSNALLWVTFTNQNQGTLNVNAGSLTLGGGGSLNAGTVNVLPDATLGFVGTFTIDMSITAAGTIAFLGGTVIDNDTLSAATLNIYGGTVTFNSPVTADNGEFDAGTLTGYGPFTISDAYTWAGGILAIASTVIAPGAILTLADDGEDLVPFQFMDDGAVLNNAGTIQTQGYTGIELGTDTGTATLNNTGTLLIAGTSTQLSVPFNNGVTNSDGTKTGGTVSVQTGTLILSGGGAATSGDFLLADATNLTFAGTANYTLDNGSSLNEAAAGAQGIVFFASGQTIINGSFNLYQIAIDGGQAIVNGSGICSQVLLSYGTLGGAGLVDVTGNFDWTGGSLAGGTVPGTLTIGAGANLFLFQGYLTASNYYITINFGANGYLFEQALVSFQGGVTFTNAGTFTAYDACTINGTSTDSFNNTGTFNSGGTSTGSTALQLAFNNTDGTVSIQAGVLSVQSGVSTGLWNISTGAALNVVGTGSGMSAQVYTFNPGSYFSFPAAAQGAATTPGLILVDGAGDGGMAVQTNLVVNQLSLYGGTLSGSGNVTVTGQMVWFGGTMNTAQAGNNGTFGNISISTGAALFVIDTEVNGQDQIPVLARPLNIMGQVGWIGSTGSIAVGGQATPLTLMNTQTMIENMKLADIPAASSWNTTLPYGGYGDAFALARALNTVLTGSAWAAAVTVGGGWTGNFTTLSWGSSVSTLFQNLPAIERASVAVAYAALFSTSLSTAIANETTLSVGSIPLSSYSAENNNAYLTGDKTDQGKRPVPVTLLTLWQMEGGLVVGITTEAVGQVAGLATLLYSLVTAPITTTQAVIQGVKNLVTTLQTDGLNGAVAALCPNWVQAATLASNGQLWTYQGGVAIGKVISQVVVNSALSLATGGATNLINVTFGVLLNTAKAAVKLGVAATKATWKLASPVLSAAAKVVGPVAVAARAGASLVINAAGATGAKLKAAVAVPLNALVQRVTPRKMIGCFVAGTPLLTPTGSKSIEQFVAGDLVLSRDENNPEGKIEAKRVEEVFIREALVLTIRVQGQEIVTTAEHPFWVRGKGWINAGEVQVGDGLLSHSGEWVTAEEVKDTGRVETVYNLRVANYHTYFVGASNWRFSVWSHNTGLGDCGSAVRRAQEADLLEQLGMHTTRTQAHHPFFRMFRDAIDRAGVGTGNTRGRSGRLRPQRQQLLEQMEHSDLHQDWNNFVLEMGLNPALLVREGGRRALELALKQGVLTPYDIYRALEQFYIEYGNSAALESLRRYGRLLGINNPWLF